MPLWTAMVVLAAPVLTAFQVGLYDDGGQRMGWVEFMRSGPQLMAGWYGTVVFGLVAAYLFGREYGEGTSKELFTLPLRREYFFAAKMVVLALWCLGLALWAVMVQAGYATLLGLDGASWTEAGRCLVIALKVTVLLYATVPWAALLAMVGRGYLAPMVYSSMAAAIGLGLAEAGWARWFPWSMPLSVSGMALFPSVPMPALVAGSWALAGLVFVTGSGAAVWYVDRADSAQ
jgi:ABC-2 type transport system permease protein